jgi:A/G-specific adenine glycosylase
MLRNVRSKRAAKTPKLACPLPQGSTQSLRFAPHVSLLLAWFAQNARDLPWRRTFDPYAIWVSEIMLQQTQVKTVIPYWERWMRELPNVAALARASSEKIHKLWEGLGYYTRVRNMQKAAQHIVAQHGGVFPTSYDAVLALPGIGRYTAGAICSIAFNAPTPILDGNVIRVLTRLFAIRENAKDKETNGRLWALAEELVGAASEEKLQAPRSKLQKSTKHQTSNSKAEQTEGACEAPHSSLELGSWSFPGAWMLRLGAFPSGPCSALNQSLMELGALICTPRAPKCDVCPLRDLCAARHLGLVEQLPNLGERAAATARRFIAAVLERNGRVLVRQRPAGVVNGHLWEFPNVEVPLKDSAKAARAALEGELGCPLETVTALTTVKHSITRYRISLEAWRVQLNGSLPKPAAGMWLRKEELEKLPFTSAHRRVLRAAFSS